MAKNDPRVTKRKVTMRGVSSTIDDDGNVQSQVIEVADYVHPEHLDAYVADARTRWPSVSVSDEPDAGPGGYEGEYTLPSHINHPDAGVTRPAEES